MEVVPVVHFDDKETCKINMMRLDNINTNNSYDVS